MAQHPAPAVVVVDQSEAAGESLDPPDLPHGLPPSQLFRAPNAGFAAGCNAGVRAFAGPWEFLWLINPDAVASPGAMQALLAAMQADPRLGAVASDLGAESPGGTVCLPLGLARSAHVAAPGFLSAASLLVRRTALEAAGGLDERFFLYWEDVDLCRRLSLRGWRLAVARDSHVAHERGGSVGNAAPLQDYYATRNALLFVARHGPGWLPLAVPAVACRTLAGKLARGEWARLSASARGLLHGLLGRTGRAP